MCIQQTKPFLAFEFIEGGDLRTFVGKDVKNVTPLDVKLQIALDIAKGIQYLHSGGAGGGEAIIHRDLKPENIMVSNVEDSEVSYNHLLAELHQIPCQIDKSLKPYRAKICDFGLAVAFKPFSLARMNFAGTPNYAAPEVLKVLLEKSPDQSVVGPRYNEKLDVWSFGMVLLYLFSRKVPFQSVNRSSLEKHAESIQNEQYRPEIPPEWKQDKSLRLIEELVRRCWIGKDPSQRPSVDEIVAILSTLFTLTHS